MQSLEPFSVFQQGRSFWLLVILLAAPFARLHASPLSPAYQVYTPMKQDGYVQAWNLNFLGQGHDIQVMFLVSNVGPGDQNNGSALLIHTGGQSRSYTGEHTDQSLQAIPGQFGIKTAANELKMVNGIVEAYAEFNGAKIRLQIIPTATGPLFPDWVLKGDEFFRIGVPVLQGRAVAILERDGKTVRLEGRGVVDSILSNTLPNRYARRLFLFRGVGKDAVITTGYQDLEGAYHMKLFQLRGGQWRGESVQSVEEAGVEVDPFSLYHLPRTMMMRAGDCHYEFRRNEFRGGMYVLESVSPFLRWVLKTFFAKPFVLNYESAVKSECPGARPITGTIWTSYFLIKD